MKPAAVIALALIVIGTVAMAPGLVLLGALSLLTSWLSTLWSRHGLDRVHYARSLAHDRAVWGDRVELAVSIDNHKLLPLAWLQADDYVSQSTRIREQRLTPSSRPGFAILRNVWTLAPFERVRRGFHVEASHRGVFRFESVALTVADLFGRDVAASEETRPLTFLVRPRTVPVRSPTGTLLPTGTRSARLGLIEDPSLFSGVRPFQRGDPRRRIHERASARFGRPLSKRFDPSTARQVLVALDIQTDDRPYWFLAYDEGLVESLAVCAGSIARRLLTDGAACGLAVNGWTYSLARLGYVPPQAGREQLTRIADLLARTSSHPSMPFADLLARLPRRLAAGTIVVTLSSRDPVAYLPALRRVRQSGHDVRHVALGPGSSSHVASLRRVGIDASSARLDPDWQSSDALILAR